MIALKTSVKYDAISCAAGEHLVARLNSEDIELFHLSFARDDEFIKKKIKMSSHAEDVKSDWFEKKWKNFKPGDENLSPFIPEQFKTAVEYPLEKLPPKLSEYFQKIKDKV